MDWIEGVKKTIAMFLTIFCSSSDQLLLVFLFFFSVGFFILLLFFTHWFLQRKAVLDQAHSSVHSTEPFHSIDVAETSATVPGSSCTGVPAVDGGCFPTFKHNSGGDGDSNDCVVCLSELEGGDGTGSRILSGCGHAFHVDCINAWLRVSRPACPICRAPVPSDGSTSTATAAAETTNPTRAVGFRGYPGRVSLFAPEGLRMEAGGGMRHDLRVPILLMY